MRVARRRRNGREVEDHPRGEQKRGDAAAKDTVISYRSGTEEGGSARRTQDPRDVPGGPRPVETAQRLKARGIILL